MRFCSCRERLGRLPGIRSQPAGRPSVALWETQTGPDLPVVHGESGDARRVDPRSRFCVFFYFPLRFSFCCSHWTQSGVSRLSPMVQTPSEVLHDFRTQILNIVRSQHQIDQSGTLLWSRDDSVTWSAGGVNGGSIFFSSWMFIHFGAGVAGAYPCYSWVKTFSTIFFCKVMVIKSPQKVIF